MLRAKSVHSPIEDEDGLRILVTRLRGRGLPKTRYDVWMANLGPSEKLLRRVQGGGDWREFERLYKQEIYAPAAVDAANRTIKNHGQKFTLRLLRCLAEQQNVALLCHCDEAQRHCHRHILKQLIARA